MNYKRLFSPISIKNMHLKNRLAMPAISLVYSPDGYINKRITEFYLKRARGGVGLITIGGCPINRQGGSFSMISLDKDEYIDKLHDFTEAIHNEGTKTGAQLFHNGRYAKSKVTGIFSLAPSAVFSKYSNEMPQEMSKKDIESVLDDFAKAAERVQKAGFDMVELIASAGYLISQFLSPLTNLRTDEFGGSFENRTNFPVLVVKKVREAIGIQMPIFMRISGNDFVTGSSGSLDAVKFARLMEKCGVDAINVTGGWHETTVPQITGNLPQGGFVYLAAEIKKALSIPVYASNRITDMHMAEEILALKMADGINLARPLICDPDLPNKTKNKKSYLVRRCIACQQACMDNSFKGKPLSCAINPLAGQEYETEILPAEKKKNILIIGGGPAGMQTALTAAKRGHKVTLWEKSHQLGGQINLAAKASGKHDFSYLVDYLTNSIIDLNVTIKTNFEATKENVLKQKADIVVIATGAKPKTPQIPNEGFKGDIYHAHDILSGDEIAGKDVVIIGGGAVGCETAVFLAQQATLSPKEVKFLLFNKAESYEAIEKLINNSYRNVTIIEQLDKIGQDIGPGTRWVVMKEIKQLSIEKILNAQIKTLTDERLCITTKDGATIDLKADTIVFATGSASENNLYKHLEEKHSNIYLIGDALQPRKITDAIKEAIDIAKEF